MLLPISSVIAIVAHLIGGNGVRQTAKLLGISKDTVMRWAVVVGLGCERLLDRRLRDLRIYRLEFDELHSYVHTKRRHLTHRSKPEHGDVWGYLALDPDSKLLAAYKLGSRSMSTTDAFVRQVRERVLGRPSIATDGYVGYLTAIARWFPEGVDYTQVVKAYQGGRGYGGLPVADIYVSSTRTAILGRPDTSTSSTSHIERLNGTVRSRLSKFSRRTPRQARSLRHLETDFAMFAAAYNFVDVHGTTKMTPAQAVGITERPWSLVELVELALAEPAPEVEVDPETEPEPDELLIPVGAAQVQIPTPMVMKRPPSANDLTPREQRVLDVLRGANTRTLAELGTIAFPDLAPKKGNSWARNQLRGLVASRLAEKVSRGTYRAVPIGGEALPLPERLVDDAVAAEACQ